MAFFFTLLFCVVRLVVLVSQIAPVVGLVLVRWFAVIVAALQLVVMALVLVVRGLVWFVAATAAASYELGVEVGAWWFGWQQGVTFSGEMVEVEHGAVAVQSVAVMVSACSLGCSACPAGSGSACAVGELPVGCSLVSAKSGKRLGGAALAARLRSMSSREVATVQ